MNLPLAVHSIPLEELLEPGTISTLLTQTTVSELHTLSQSFETSLSANCLQFIKLSIQPSNVGIDAGSEAGDNLVDSAGLPISTSIFESMTDVV